MRGLLESYKIDSPKLDGFYRGVVEDTEDPLEMERCKIRIFGVHSENTTDLPTDCLPWAEKAGPLFGQGGVSGGGVFGIPIIGAVVWCFFEAGNIQKPIYFATCSGKPSKSTNFSKGFATVANPQNIKKKKFDGPDFKDGLFKDRQKNAIKNIQTTGLLSISTYNEPLSQPPAGYGSSFALETTSGTAIEFDGDPKTQRLVLHHPAGSFLEFQLKGAVLFKTAADKYETTYGDSFEYSSGDKYFNAGNIDILGRKSRSTLIYISDDIKVGGARTETYGGIQKTYVGGDKSLVCIGFNTVEIGAYQDIKVAGHQAIDVGAHQSTVVAGAQILTVGGRQDIEIGGLKFETIGGNETKVVGGMQEILVSGASKQETGGFHTISAGGMCNIFAGGELSLMGANMTLTAGIINISGGMIILN